MRKEKRLKALDHLLIWHPFTQMKEWLKEDPLIIKAGKGNYLIDTRGRRYLDGISSMWVNVHGHRKRAIDDAIKAQLKKIAHSTLLGLSNIPSIELADSLVRIAPKGLKKCFFSDNGSTAVEVALKMSFQYWAQKRDNLRKRRFIAFTGAYHGDTFGAMSVGEIDAFVKRFRPLLFDAIRSPYPYCYRCPLKKTHPSCRMECLNAFEDKLRKRHNEIAACIIEPVFEGASGMIVAPEGFLSSVREITKRYNCLLIADEVATGFGRTGRMFACGLEGISPDILCIAKGLTGGYLPLAATIATDEVFNAFLGEYDEHKAFFHGHTYTGNQLGCVAALANIKVFEDEGVIKGLKPKTRVFKDEIKSLKGLRHVGDARQVGLTAGIELVRDKETKRGFPPGLRMGHRVCMEARKHGLIIRPLGDTIVVMPPLSITRPEIKKIFDIVCLCIRRVTEEAIIA